ncbi:hypothetical protein AB1Y20_004429 [Prymnesium parvum]|uniref:Tetraspanin n=1 Tax=Prymnesium parvum TaxID=97485 RepID=A0AB34IXM5_PRYPA
MKCRLSCCGSWYCLLDLPARVLLRCTAKLFVLTFSSLMLLIAVPTIIAGIVSLHHESFAARIVPPVAADLLLATGLLLALSACCGFGAAACAVTRRRCTRCLLCVLMAFTLASLLLSLLGAASALAYAQLADVARTSGFGDVADASAWVETSFYAAIERAFLAAWDECRPQAYLTAAVRAACASLRPHAACARLPAGFLGLACARRPAAFELDVTFALPSLPHAPLRAAAEVAWWFNWACMPNASEALQLVRAAGRTDVYSSWDVPTAEPLSPSLNASFQRCFSSSWWAHNSSSVLPPEVVPLRDAYPNGSTSLAPEDIDLFGALDDGRRGTVVGIDPKTAFCFCAIRGTESSLYQYMRNEAALQSTAVVLCAVFASLTLLSECYLCFGLRRAPPPRSSEEREMLVQSTMLVPKEMEGSEAANQRIGALSAWPGTSVRHEAAV